MRKSSQTFRLWLPLLVLLVPLLWLIFLAWQGARNEVQTISYLQRDAAEQKATEIARRLADLTRHPQVIPWFADPPAPGKASPLDEILDGDDRDALLDLSRNEAAGDTPAGLPRQALAAMKLRRLGAFSSTGAFITLLTEKHPSALTGLALREIPSEAGAGKAWADLERLRPQAERDANLGWMLEKNLRCCWLKGEPGHWLYVPWQRVHEVITDSRRNEIDFVFRLSDGITAPASSVQALAHATVPGGNGLRVDVFSSGSGRFEDMSGQSKRWGNLSLGGAVAATLIGIYLMQRTLSRERKLNEMKSQFVASVSHELRSPVASIRLMAEALESGKVEGPAATEFHRLIAREGARLSTLVGNVLDHARLEQGRRIWRIEPANLAEVVSDTIRVMEPLAQEKDIRFEVEAAFLDSGVDAGAIQQALVNLLDNAIKFSPQGSAVQIELKTYDKTSSWEIRVHDHGPGVPAKEQTRIFERFYRPGDELRRETQGTGIGLSLVKAIAEAHGGTAFVESESGHGSTFILRVPFA